MKDACIEKVQGIVAEFQKVCRLRQEGLHRADRGYRTARRSHQKYSLRSRTRRGRLIQPPRPVLEVALRDTRVDVHVIRDCRDESSMHNTTTPFGTKKTCKRWSERGATTEAIFCFRTRVDAFPFLFFLCHDSLIHSFTRSLCIQAHRPLNHTSSSLWRSTPR